MALWVPTRAAVAQTKIKQAIGAKQQGAAIVVGKGLADFQDDGFRAGQGNPGTIDRNTADSAAPRTL